MRGRLLPRRLPLVLVRCGRSHPRAVILAAVLSWFVAGFMATRIVVETDILSLVPQDNQAVENFKSTIERFGSVDTLLVVLRLGPDREADLAFADELADELRASPLIDWVEYRLELSIELIEPLLDRGVLFLDGEQAEVIVNGLDEHGLDELSRRIYAELMAPQGAVLKSTVTVDPFGLVPSLLSRVRFGGIGANVDPESGALIDSDGRMLLMLARPVRPAQDLAFNRQLITDVEGRVESATERWRDLGWDGTPPPVEFTGGYVVTLDDSELIVSDAVIGLGSSLIGVMLVFLLAFRRRAAMVYALLSIVTGLCLTFIFGALALGRMNSLTSAFGGLLVGLGIDFIIVLYGRYVEERLAGHDHADAVDAMGQTTGVGVLLGAVTTSATFYAFLVTDFRGLWELGLLTGTGILLLVGTVYLLLPALLTALQDRRTGSNRHVIYSFGAERLCAMTLRRARIAVLIIVAVTCVLGWGMRWLRFDDDIRNMRSADNEGSMLRTEVMQTFGLRFTPMTVRVDGVTQGEALSVARDILPGLEALVDGDNLAGIDTIADLIPAEETQREVIEVLRAHADRTEGFEDRFRTALHRAGLNPAPFEDGIEIFSRALAVREPLSLRDLEGTFLETITSRYLASFDGGVSVAIRCYPPAGKWQREAPAALIDLLARYPQAVLTGPNVVSAELRRIVWGDSLRASLLGIVLVFLLMWADFGSPSRSALALFPLALGLVWMLGAMALLGLKINFMNIFVVTMVIGIGVDYGVHLMHRWVESNGDPEAVTQTAKAIAVAAITTMVGFGSLVLSHFPGLRSVGAAAILGALATALLSMTALPVMLRYGDRRRRRQHGS